MNSRETFLKTLFRSLEAEAVAYCVLRNYAAMESNAPADVDLLVENKDLGRFITVLRASAEEAGQRFVHHARYVNHSFVFWSVEAGFTRIDFDTEIRWRLFPLLSARSILARRQPLNGFFIPHPCDESAVLFSQAIWTGKLEERYRNQLARLHAACNPDELLQTYRSAFGRAADELLELHAQIEQRKLSRDFCAKLKRSLIWKTLAQPGEWGDFAANAVSDARRLWQRVREPAGISILYVSSSGKNDHLDGFLRQIEFLFPAQKCFLHRLDLTGNGGSARWGMGLELRRLRALFKGGLCLQFYRLATDAELPEVIKANSHRFYPSRSFVCEEDSNGRASLTHAGSGSRAGIAESSTTRETDFSALLIGFISAVLEKQNHPGTSPRRLVYTVL